MNFSWKLAKILFASLLIIAAIGGAIKLLSPTSYSGANLSFPIGHGAVTMTNPSPEPVTVQVLATGTRSFRLASATEGISGTSTKLGTGSSTTQQLDLILPAGETIFSVTGGTNLSFASVTETLLEAKVDGLSEIEVRATYIIAAILIFGALFYISRSTDHRWLSMLRGQTAVPVVASVVKPIESAQGTSARSYGDNRK